MLHYLWTVIQEIFISVTVITLLTAFTGLLSGRKGKLAMGIGVGVGLVAATVRAIMHAIQSTPDVRINLYAFYIGACVLILLIPGILCFGRKSAPAWDRMAVCALSAAMAADLLFYKAWKIIWAPAEFDTAGNGLLSVEFFLRFAGWALTLILLAVYARFLYKCARRVAEDLHLWNDRSGAPTGRSGFSVLRLTVLLEALTLLVIYYGQILRTWRTHRPWRPGFMPEMGFERDLSMFVGNSTVFFIIAVGLIALIPGVVMFCRSLTLRGVWDNPAQKRRLRADNRHNRRWAAMVAACLAIAIFNITVVYAVDNRTVEPPSSEEWTTNDDGSEVLVPIEQVEDYNLHAFEMKTENNVTVRWIIIRKPNSAAYGVGLDACDVCGTAGYFQRGETVVCKKCDVVMNTNTIGLAGGCNPIPLEFKVEGGYIAIPMEKLLAAEKKFK